MDPASGSDAGGEVGRHSLRFCRLQCCNLELLLVKENQPMQCSHQLLVMCNEMSDVVMSL